MKLNLRTKLLGGLAAMLLMIIVIGSVNMYLSNRTQNRLQSIINRDSKSVDIIADLGRTASFVHSNCLLHLFERHPDDMDRYESEIADWVSKISRNFETLKGSLKDQAILDKFRAAETSWKTYLRVWNEQVKPLSRANLDEEAFALVRKRGSAGAAVKKAMYELNTLYDGIVERMEYRVELAEQDFKKNQLVLLAIILAAIIFGLAFGLRLSSRIAGAVNRVSKAAKRVAAGDLDQKVEVKTGDEIESMADSFNIMTGRLKTMMEAEEKARKELQSLNETLEQRVVERTRDLKDSNEMLMAARARMEHLLVSSPAVIYSCEPGGDYGATFMSKNVKEQFGYEPQEFVNDPRFWSNHIHPEDRARVFAGLSPLFEKGLHSHEYRFQHNDGTYRWMRDELRLVLDAEGNPVECVGCWIDISERKESEEKYRNIFNNAQVGIFQTSISDGKVLECNDRFARMYGYKTRQECVDDLVVSEHYTDPGTREKMLASLIEEGEVNNFEACFSRKDGEAVWARFFARAYPEEGYLEGIGYDITEEKRVLEALRESEEKYREVVETSVDGVISVDSQMKVGVWNKGAERVFGYTEQEMIGQSLMEIVPERYRKEKEKGFIEFRKSGLDPVIGKTLELQGLRKDGTEIPVELSVSSRKKDETHIATAIVRDISERRRADEALKREKEKFRVLVEESPFGISIIGRDGHYRYTNPGFSEIFGYGIEDIPTGKEWFRKAFPDEEYSRQVISTWINDGRESKPGEPRPRIFKVMCKDGSQKEIKFISVILESGDQFVIYEDITKEKSLEDQLRQSQKMEAVGRLAGGVAHDFNNVLMTIMGYADLALMSLAEDDPLRRDLKEIKGGGKRAAALTRQLLAFSRKQILQPVVLDLNELIKGFVKMLERLIGEDVELETVLASGLRRVEADPGQLEQVIMNLVINARDAMPDGGKLTIETVNADLDDHDAMEHDVSLQPGPYVMLGVSDVGMGMDEETRSLIFEPFFTTKEEGKGTGLGLSTVYGIVKQSGGYIWVYSEPGQGTTFKIYLPAVEADALQIRKEQISSDNLTGSETILIVEDDDALRKLACKILQPQGYSILEAKNGIEALRISEEHGDQIHLMITDVVMPKMGGRELEERLRPLRPEMKVIYMSGYTDNAILHHGVLRPEIEFLQKPISSEALKRKVREVLDQ